MNANILVFDLGSTYTKAVAYRLDGETLSLLGVGQSPTTLSDVAVGAIKAENKIRSAGIQFDNGVKRYSSCSAAGGLRMVAMGYMPKVTAKAAKEVAMTAGARVMEVISADEPPAFREEVLYEIRPDIILLAGGTDNGDESSALENAEIIAKAKVKATVIIACNKNVQRRVANRLKKANITYIRVPNIIPTIHELNTKPAREAIHGQFINQIVNAQGIQDFCKNLTNGKVMPTPGAILQANELLSKGIYGREGIGSTLLIDLGGATTDIHSALPELEDLKLEERGLVINNEKQFSYRTVEGNLGMRVSAGGVLEAVGAATLLHCIPKEYPLDESQIVAYIDRVEEETTHIPGDATEMCMDHAIAACAIHLALKRHAGIYAKEDDAVMGVMAGTAMGRDLRYLKNIVCVGGVFVNATHEQRMRILDLALMEEGNSLLPINPPRIQYDNHYILFSLGVLGKEYPEAVLDYMMREWHQQ